MRKLLVMLSVTWMCAVFLTGCNLNQMASHDKAAKDRQVLISGAQDNVKATIGQNFMTIKLEDGTAYTWDKGLVRDDLQAKIDTMLSSLMVKKVGIKKRPSPFIAMLFQNISVIIPYHLPHPEKNIIIETDESTYIGECAVEDLQALMDWFKTHHVKIG